MYPYCVHTPSAAPVYLVAESWHTARMYARSQYGERVAVEAVASVPPGIVATRVPPSATPASIAREHSVRIMQSGIRTGKRAVLLWLSEQMDRTVGADMLAELEAWIEGWDE